MSKVKYVVLQDLSNSNDNEQDLAVLSSGKQDDKATDLAVYIDDMTADQAAKEAANPKTLQIAREMPLALIEPSAGSSVVESNVTGGSTWGLESIGAHNTKLDGTGITVAILDTGIDRSHETFSRSTTKIVEKNFTNGDPIDTNGHGTHCAGTIFGTDVEHNGQALKIGVANGIEKALIGKVIGNSAGTGALMSAMTWARDNGAHVVSMSLGFNHVRLLENLEQQFPKPKAVSQLLAIYLENMRLFDTLTQHMAIQASGSACPIIIAASGNESQANGGTAAYRINSSSPSTAMHVLSVGALGRKPDKSLYVCLLYTSDAADE